MRTLFLVCKVNGKAGSQEGFLDVGSTERGIMVNEANSTYFAMRPYTGTTYHKYGYLLHVIGEDGTFSDYTTTPNTTTYKVPNTFILSAQCDETSGAFGDYQNKTYYLGRGWHRGVRAWFGEVIGYDRLLSKAEVADVEAYLKNKWFTIGPVEGAVPTLAEDTSVSLKNGGTLDLGGASATVDSLYTDATGGSFVGDVTLTGTLTVDVRGAQAIASPLTVDGDLTLSDAEVNFLNYTNIEPERWQTFLTRELIPALLEKNVDGFFADNCDVYYHYPTKPVMDGLTVILRALVGTGKAVLINGGDAYLDAWCSGGGRWEDVITGINQETVFSKILWCGNRFGKASKEDRVWFTDYIERYAAKGADIYLLEYTRSRSLKAQIVRYCREHGFTCYISDSVELD